MDRALLVSGGVRDLLERHEVYVLICHVCYNGTHGVQSYMDQQREKN